MDLDDLDNIEKKALEQLKSGKSLFGKDGAFAPLLKGFIEKGFLLGKIDRLEQINSELEQNNELLVKRNKIMGDCKSKV